MQRSSIVPRFEAKIGTKLLRRKWRTRTTQRDSSDNPRLAPSPTHTRRLQRPGEAPHKNGFEVSLLFMVVHNARCNSSGVLILSCALLLFVVFLTSAFLVQKHPWKPVVTKTRYSGRRKETQEKIWYICTLATLNWAPRALTYRWRSIRDFSTYRSERKIRTLQKQPEKPGPSPPKERETHNYGKPTEFPRPPTMPEGSVSGWRRPGTPHSTRPS